MEYDDLFEVVRCALIKRGVESHRIAGDVTRAVVRALEDKAAPTAERDALKAALDAARSLAAFAQHHPNCPDKYARNCSCGYTEAYKGNAEKYTALADLRRAALVRE
jgi:hypothetical protein